MESSTVQELLLHEARAEIGRLRTENFQAKRLEEERKYTLQAVTTERDQLRVHCQHLEVRKVIALYVCSEISHRSHTHAQTHTHTHTRVMYEE